MDILRVAVFGAGQMGSGIAQVFAQAGLDVVLIDTEPGFVDRGMQTIVKYLGRSAEKKKITAKERDDSLARIRGTTNAHEAAGCGLVLEAIIEDRQLKQTLFRELDAMLPPEVVFASNTSSISITSLAAATKRPALFVGMHFFNPVPVMKLVEVIRGAQTSDETMAVIHGLCQRLGKTPVEVRDFPGFISNRILMPYLNESMFALMEGVATKEAIDAIAKLGFNQSMGPLELADFIGLDTCLHIMEVLYDGFRDPRFRPCPLLRQMVAAGQHGRKSGRGFYDYSSA